jgi:hypothetical protein
MMIFGRGRMVVAERPDGTFHFGGNARHLIIIHCCGPILGAAVAPCIDFFAGQLPPIGDDTVPEDHPDRRTARRSMAAARRGIAG